MRIHTPLIKLTLCLFAAAPAHRVCGQTPPPAAVFAIVGARIEIGDGRVIEKGTVVLRDGVIEAVGPDVAAPADAQVIKGDGLTVYPGFIDACVNRGLALPDPSPTQDTPPDTTATVSPSMREANRKGVRPELRAADVLALTDDVLKPERLAGFTTDLFTPSGGTINGVGALVNLNGLPRRDCVVLPVTIMDFSFGTSGSGYPGSLMGIIAFTRQTLLDAQRYRTLQTAFGRGGSERPPDDPALESLQPVISGAMPALYSANTEREIRRALELSHEFNLQLWINGGVEAYKTARDLSSAHVPVIVSLNFGAEPGVRASPGGGGAGPNGSPGAPRGNRRNRPGGGGAGSAPGAAPNQPQRPSGAQTSPPAVSPEYSGPSLPPAEDDTPKVVVEERHKKWEEKVANAARLVKAGVVIALTTEGVRNQTEFMVNLRKAIAAGLSREDALKALTINAARLLKVDRQLGTVEAGKTAAIVVMTGDFAQPQTTVKYLFIDKQKFDPANDAGPLIPAPQRRRGGDDDEE